MAFWGVEVKPGKPFTHSPDKSGGRLRISQATLGIGSSNNKSLIQCNVGRKSPVLLSSLLPGVLESCHLELEFEEAEEVIFSVIGGRSVHLTGYYLSKVRQLGGIDESESYGEDVEKTDTEGSDYRSDEDDEYESSFIDDGDPEVAPPSPSSDEVANKKKTKKKKADNRKQSRRRLKKKYELSESEDDYVPSEHDAASDQIECQIVQSDNDYQLPIASMLGNVTSAEDSNRQVYTSNEDKSEERKGRGDKRKSNKDNKAPAADTAAENQSEEKKVKKKKRKSSKEDEAAAGSTADEIQSEEKKAKKKRRKSGKENEAPPDTEGPQDLGDNGADLSMKPREAKTDLVTCTLSGGLVVEELDIGSPDGKVAISGKKVTIDYTGKLKEGGQVFDSTVGKNPLKFRLGKGDALDGLDTGIEGMRVGGKRRLLIPPALGFGDEGSKRVPPKSWLIMDVELLKVH